MRRELKEVNVGDVWLDRDQRMLSGRRKVKVISADANGSVAYRSFVGDAETGQTYRSRYGRFQRAFDLVTESL